MTDSNIRLSYRIRSQNGILYVRESHTGAVVGRVPSVKSTLNSSDAPDVACECVSVFLGNIESIRHDADVVHVVCSTSLKQPN